EYGLFKQEIKNGEQVEQPDNWRRYGTPWAIQRPQDAVVVPLYGRVEHATDHAGNYKPMWLDWQAVNGLPHQLPIVGYGPEKGSDPLNSRGLTPFPGGRAVNYLRLFAARASQDVDIRIFNEGDYLAAVQQQVESETISKILYPSESVAAGR